MPDVLRAEITDLTVMSPDLVVLTYTVHGAVCRIGFGANQIELLRVMSARADIAMRAAREGRAAPAD